MKKVVFMFILGILIFGGCISIPSSKVNTHRRVFESVIIADNSLTAPFVVREYINDSSSYSKETVYFSTALFLSDLGILNEITKEQFENYAAVVFSEFPRENQVKEIIIPNLSRSIKEDSEKNAHLFITKQKNNEGRVHYLVESNIPIAGVNNMPYYDGYVMKIDSGFWKNHIPASWTSIMNLHFIGNNLFYRGIAYPSKSAPLIITDRGIGSDTRMNAVISGESTIAETKDKLKETVETAIKNTVPENQSQLHSMRFLEKTTNISLSAYSYIEGNFNEAKKYYSLSEEVNVDIPDSAMGRRYGELKNIMNYLLNIMGG
ncbi:MAG: hypothetical protein FWD14_04570 [Treponema sp.]|nr:hypothetical protein [Treponema sp.]